jgi:hypothetical protein
MRGFVFFASLCLLLTACPEERYRPDSTSGGGDGGGGSNWKLDWGTGGGGGDGDAGAAGEAGAADDGGGTVADGSVPLGPAAKLQQIGSPAWKPGAVHLFVGKCGTSASGFADGVKLVEQILPEHKYFPDQNLIGPKTPHQGNYDTELAQGLKAAGLVEQQTFTTAELASPSCLFIALMLVPQGGPTGSSPDFQSGSVVDPQAFPMIIDGNLHQAGKLIDTSYDFTYPAIGKLTPPVTGQSYSHMPMVFLVNDELVPQLAPGAHDLSLKILDAQSAGWRVTVAFTVN